MNITAEQLALLSPRKRQAVELLCDGFSREEICARMQITSNTLQQHLGYAHRRMGLADPWSEFVAFARLSRCKCGLLADAGHVAAGCGLGRAEDYARSGRPIGGDL